MLLLRLIEEEKSNKLVAVKGIAPPRTSDFKSDASASFAFVHAAIKNWWHRSDSNGQWMTTLEVVACSSFAYPRCH